MGQVKPFQAEETESEDFLSVSGALARALKAARDVRMLLAEHPSADLHAALDRGLKSGPLVFH